MKAKSNQSVKVKVMNPCQYTLTITAIANALAGNMSDDELNLAASVFSQIGDTLATILIVRQQCKTADTGE
jgi:hypothetical protein